MGRSRIHSPLHHHPITLMQTQVSNDAGDPVAAGTLKAFIDQHIPVESDREQRVRSMLVVVIGTRRSDRAPTRASVGRSVGRRARSHSPADSNHLAIQPAWAPTNPSTHPPPSISTIPQRRRDRVLEFRQLFLEWVQRVCRAKDLPEEVVAVAGGEVRVWVRFVRCTCVIVGAVGGATAGVAGPSVCACRPPHSSQTPNPK